MNISYSINTGVSFMQVRQDIRQAKEAGFTDVLLDMGNFYSKRWLEKLGKDKAASSEEEISDKLLKAVEVLEANELAIPLLMAPCLPADTKREDLNGLLLQSAKEGIELCKRLEAKYIVIPPLFAGIETKASAQWNKNKSFYLELARKCEGTDVCILLINQVKNMGGHLVRGNCAEALEAVTWMEELNTLAGRECFGFCMDVGVCNLCGLNMQEMIRKLGAYLKAVILRDNDGHHDAAMMPFTSVTSTSATDWLSLIRGLRENRFDGHLILNIADTLEAFSVLLRPGVLTLAKSVADYFKWQIEIEAELQKYDTVVLFGAGNMCRNYMKCYGEKYPPLFTCDNNKHVWGTEFCGLEVKPPEALCELPENCGVIICNMYYKEIEQQLREMGIENIGYFNDEYMPSFYFDRLEMK